MTDHDAPLSPDAVARLNALPDFETTLAGIHSVAPATVTDPRALLNDYADTIDFERGDLLDERESYAPAAFAALRAVLDLHPEVVLTDYNEHICLHCSDDRQHNVPWPCPTVQAVTVALEAK